MSQPLDDITSLTADRLPERPDGYAGGKPFANGEDSWWFEGREDAEAAVLWAAREKAKGEAN